MIKAKCENCKFLYQEDEKIFVCRRYPPQMVAVGNALEMHDMPSFPRILSPKFEWCGEYKEEHEDFRKI